MRKLIVSAMGNVSGSFSLSKVHSQEGISGPALPTKHQSPIRLQQNALVIGEFRYHVGSTGPDIPSGW